MKTKNITAALSLALILLGTTLVYAASTNPAKNTFNTGTLIRYQVTLSIAGDPKMCNMWVIQITDGKGNMIAPMQVYMPGQYRYYFYERGRVTGVRVAKMVMAPNMHFNCAPEFSIAPDIKYGTFLPGQTVEFSLSPVETEPTK